jgi:RNA polymerase sigma-70 factor, ECF subfamily
MTPPEPGGLLAQAAAGEEAALAELYLSLRERVVALCRRLLRSTGEAEEAAADVLLRLGRLARDYDGSITFHGWVLRAAAHPCIDRLRRRRLEQHWLAEQRPPSHAATGSSPIATLILEEERTRLARAIERLPDPLRVALVLRYYEDLSYAEIAERMEIPKSTVGTYLFRAKAALRCCLGRASSHGGLP